MKLRPVGEGRLFELAVPDRPFNPGEIVIRAKREVSAFEALTDEELAEIGDWLERIETVIQRVYTPQGLNMGASSGTGPDAGRFRLHVVPRWSGDMNFMPVIAGVKVLPASPEETREVYRDALF